MRSWELEAASPAYTGINGQRGRGWALPSVLLVAGCSEGFVFERGRRCYCLSTSMGLLKLLVALAGREGAWE